MKQLKSITLSNIRRYGADTKIELSDGATILLAPNGTGKTAFFEAIEFSLTGNISRLGENLSPIIRDSQTVAKVILDFGDVHASAQVSNGGDVERTGDLSSLFPDTNSEDIPFLLRLTHLLDQREGEWLVKADAKVAGAQLARLPIGKDGALVSNALGSIRRVLTEKLKQAEGALEALEAEFREWQSLILERDLAASQSQGALRSKENIAKSISDIARNTQSVEQLPAGLLVPPVGISSLETMHDALEQAVQAKLNGLREQIAALVEVDGLIGRFVSEQARSEQLGNTLITAKGELTQKQQERSQIADKKDKLQKELVTAEAERDVITQQLNRLNSEVRTKETLEQRKHDLASADKTLTDAESLLSTFRRVHEGNEQLRMEHELISKQRKALQLVDSELLTSHQLIKRWEEILQYIATITESISNEEIQEHVLRERLHSANSLKASAEADELSMKQLHETLTSTSDSIRQSLASIAAHLPDDRGDCPLCGVEHGAAVLHERIAKSLETIDPKVIEVEQRVKAASDHLRKCIEAVMHAETDLKACQSKIVELQGDHVRSVADINQLKTNILLDGDTVQLAKASIQRREESNASAKQLLDEKQLNLAPLPTPEILEASKNAYQTATRELDAARQNRTGALASFEQTTAVLAAITADALPSKTLADLSTEQNKNTIQLSELKSKIEAEQSALDRQNILLTEANNKVSGLEKQITDAQAQLASIRYSWRQLSFSGDPAAEVASSKEIQLQSSVADLTRNSEQLQTLKIEIGAWSKLEQTRLAQGLIDRRRGTSTEEEFAASLSQRIDSERSGQIQLQQLSEAMKTLNRRLSAEISNVQKHVLSVVPRWQALLKRVVREPRFTGTSLGFRSIYRKEHAEVSVSLHGASVPVPAIASEAQLTDLQLTFLLSMALEHQWSSWRCLLLDDPTQHHDLVHAASVFDLLRDYIVDHGFQVVIATHDALQARYFMRKLQNDGIHARLWSLVPTPEGVTASEMQIT
ncbi:AAA family ATPase [Photorhabdus laumondii]|uniref:Chromosome segregation protein SMC n=1 Tax=Photorhabdus laumondii subsp. clarkei TaxID=2029685 RepID=A0A329VIN6_9GAMM|nr:AAA family ATPase [Photorhabdus laumondii]RAW92056.1 chromosome segregation protein SMC [Photorhabdus laumondii subsp. clarkei]